jgi:hypothetical protein
VVAADKVLSELIVQSVEFLQQPVAVAPEADHLRLLQVEAAVQVAVAMEPIRDIVLVAEDQAQ